MSTAPPIRMRVPPDNQMLLPFAEKEYVSVKRAASILGVAYRTVLDMYSRGLIEIIGYAAQKRKCVRYQSLVNLCDHLRAKYCIKDRRPKLDADFFRHRDADLLPFPLSDTINIKEACDALGYASLTPVYEMIEEGRFEAYQFMPISPWRISRSSLQAYIAAAHQRATGDKLRPSLS